MKIKGVDLGKPYIETVVIPRGEGCIVFEAQAVLDYSDFFALCPVPKPVAGIRRDSNTGNMVDYLDTEDPKYQASVDTWCTQKVSWMILQSLKATPGLEWDTVISNDPTTWTNYRDELRKANFSETEIERIITAVTIACGLNESKIQEATKSFLAGRAAQQSVKSSLSSEQLSMPSGVPANV